MSKTYSEQVFLGYPKQAGADNHAHVVEEDDDVFLRCTFDANGASEGLKASKHWGVRVGGGSSTGGIEDTGMDFVRGGDLLVSDHVFGPAHGKQDVTLKGSFKRALFFRNSGLRTIVAGNYTKYDAKAIYPDGRVVKSSPFRCCRPPVRGGHVEVSPGEPKVVVRLFHSEPWTGAVVNKPLVPWMPAHRLAVAFYFWVRATFFKEKNAVPEAEFKLDPREL